MDWVLAGCRKMGSAVVGTMRECWEQMVGGRGGGRDGAQGGEQSGRRHSESFVCLGF